MTHINFVIKFLRTRRPTKIKLVHFIDEHEQMGS